MNNKTQTPAPLVATGAFAGMLSGIKRGAVLGDLDEALRELLLSINAHGKAGTLTLVVAVKPDGKSDSNSPLYSVETDITVKKPRAQRGVAKFFGDEEGNIMRNDPKQEEMQFESIPGGKTEASAASQKAAR